MRKHHVWVAGLALVTTGLACGLPPAPTQDESANDTQVAVSVAATLTAAAPATAHPTATSEPTQTPTYPPIPARLWMTYMGSGSEAWSLDGSTAAQVILPIDIGQYYDYAPSNGKVLYASHFAAVGAGPANLAVSDLWMIDYSAGTVTAIIATDTVVEAQWSPDGRALAYILATPTQYELHWRTLAGDDQILTTDLAPTWSISPAGDRVAFTRETGYELVGDPGLYVVPVSGGAEIKLSDADRHGAGGIGDRPDWSLDSTYVALSYSEPDAGTYGLVIASADGSFSTSVTYAATVDPDIVAGGLPLKVLWHPDGLHLVGLGGTVETMSGPQEAVVFDLDAARTQIVSATKFGTALDIVDWSTPGAAVWILTDRGGLSALELP